MWRNHVKNITMKSFPFMSIFINTAILHKASTCIWDNVTFLSVLTGSYWDSASAGSHSLPSLGLMFFLRINFLISQLGSNRAEITWSTTLWLTQIWFDLSENKSVFLPFFLSGFLVFKPFYWLSMFNWVTFTYIII